MRNPATRNLTVVCLSLLALVACSTDTPTAPERTPAPPPGSGTSTTWNITVSVEPRSLTASASQPATITVRVRRADNGASPPGGTTAVVSAGLGEFNSAGSGVQEVVVSLSGGIAQLLYFAGEILGTDTIQAQLENSVGSASVDIVEEDVLFIKSVAPQSGPDSGGTRIRISGTGFGEPVRVTVGGINAVVDAVGKDVNGEFIRAFTGAVLDTDAFFSTEGCDTDGDGSLDGEAYVPRTVEVEVELVTSGESDALPNAFVYRPRDQSCRETTPDPDGPRADFTFTTNGLTVLFNNRSTPAGLTYTWLFGDGTTSSEANPVHTYAVAGSYDVTLRAINSSGESTVTKTVTVAGAGSSPLADFSFADTAPPAGEITFTNLSTGTGPLTFSWDFGDASPMVATTSPVHVYAASGSYAVTLSATNASGTSTITKTVTVP